MSSSLKRSGSTVIRKANSRYKILERDRKHTTKHHYPNVSAHDSPTFWLLRAVLFSLEEDQRKAVKMIKRYEWPPGGNRLNSPALFSLKKRNLGGPDRGIQVRVTWKRYMKGEKHFPCALFPVPGIYYELLLETGYSGNWSCLLVLMLFYLGLEKVVATSYNSYGKFLLHLAVLWMYHWFLHSIKGSREGQARVSAEASVTMKRNKP